MTKLGDEELKGEIGFYEVLEPSTAEVIARFSNIDGTPPSITVNRFGKGRAIYVGTPAQPQIMEAAVPPALCKPQARARSGDARGRVCTRGARTRVVCQFHRRRESRGACSADDGRPVRSATDQDPAPCATRSRTTRARRGRTTLAAQHTNRDSRRMQRHRTNSGARQWTILVRQFDPVEPDTHRFGPDAAPSSSHRSCATVDPSAESGASESTTTRARR